MRLIYVGMRSFRHHFALIYLRRNLLISAQGVTLLSQTRFLRLIYLCQNVVILTSFCSMQNENRIRRMPNAVMCFLG